jgi:hypothetical protein
VEKQANKNLRTNDRLAAIVARLAGKGKRYIKMFAGREEMIEDDAYSLDYEGAYSYMAVKEKIVTVHQGNGR